MTIRWAYDPEKCEGYECCGDCDTCPIAYEKPKVFSYRDYMDLKKKMAHQAEEIMRLKKDNTDLYVALFQAYCFLKAEVNGDVITNNR